MIATIMYTLALLHASALTLGAATDPGDWGLNIVHWVVTKGGALIVAACTMICILGVGRFIAGDARKGMTTLGTGLVGILLGVWISSGNAATFIQSFQH